MRGLPPRRASGASCLRGTGPHGPTFNHMALIHISALGSWAHYSPITIWLSSVCLSPLLRYQLTAQKKHIGETTIKARASQNTSSQLFTQKWDPCGAPWESFSSLINAVGPCVVKEHQDDIVYHGVSGVSSAPYLITTASISA
ncbi:unnamed protein product [Leuciscus chuanchicus]